MEYQIINQKEELRAGILIQPRNKHRGSCESIQRSLMRLDIKYTIVGALILAQMNTDEMTRLYGGGCSKWIQRAWPMSQQNRDVLPS